MGWLTRHRAREYFRGSAWIVPTVAIPFALVFAIAVRHLDAETRWRGLNFSTEGAKALLGSLPTATLTFLILILSMLLLSVQLASSQLSPRLIGRLLARRAVKLSLSVFVFSYVYCTAAVGRIEDRAPQLPIVIAISLTLLSIVAGLYLVDYMAKELRPVRMLAATANVGRAVIENVYPEFAPQAATVPAVNRSTLPEPHDVIVRSGRSGVLIAMHFEGLAALSNEAGGAVEVIPQVGDFVARGDPVLHVHPGRTAINVARLQAALAFGDERTPEQDPTFVFRILVDVACKRCPPPSMIRLLPSSPSTRSTTSCARSACAGSTPEKCATPTVTFACSTARRIGTTSCCSRLRRSVTTAPTASR